MRESERQIEGKGWNEEGKGREVKGGRTEGEGEEDRDRERKETEREC